MQKSKTIKRIAVVLSFVLAFLLLLGFLQAVFIDKHYDTIMYTQFYNEPKNSIDVLFLGNSTIRSSVIPAVLWEQSGITSFNLSGQATPDAVSYYVLSEALRYQSPSVVVIDAWFVFSQEGFDENAYRFHRALTGMPLSASKLGYIADIMANSETQSYLEYLLPFFFYHNRRDLSARDFDLTYLRQRSTFMRVQRVRDTTFRSLERPPEFTDPGYEAEFGIHSEYLDKMISLCRASGIEPVLFMSPTCDIEIWSIPKGNALREYAREHGLTLLDFNADELRNAVGIDERTDFYNQNHINHYGGTKISNYLAAFLSESFNLPDRRESAYDPHWDAVAQANNEMFDLLLRRIDGEPYDHDAYRYDEDGDIG